MISKYDRFENWIGAALQRAVATIFVLLVIDVLLGVATRYLFGNQLAWTEELATFLLVWLTFLGAALAYQAQAHLGVDVLVKGLHPDFQVYCQLLTTVLVMALSLAVFCFGGFHLFAERWAAGQVMPTLGIRRAWLYLAPPLGGMFMVIFAIQHARKLLLERRRGVA